MTLLGSLLYMKRFWLMYIFFQVDPVKAIEMIDKVPPIKSHKRIASCDGGMCHACDSRSLSTVGPMGTMYITAYS